MTVCIAYVSRALGRIFTVSDMKMSTVASSRDKAILKARTLSSDQRWTCLFAAEAVWRFESIHKRAVKLIAESEHPARTPLDEIETAIATAYKDEREQMANEVLGPLPMAMDLATFEMRGRARLGDGVFSKLFDRIQGLDPKVELLVFGFDERDTPHIFKTSTLGDIQSCDAFVFGAIGTGQHVAIDLLNGTEDLWTSDDIGLITYRLCEAKFVAESADAVGPETVVASFSPEGMATLLQERGIRTARSLWRRRRKAKIPETVLIALRSAVSLDKEHGVIARGAASSIAKGVIAELQRLLELPSRVDDENLNAERVREVKVIAAKGQAIFNDNVRAVMDRLRAWDATDRKPPDFDDALKALQTGVEELKELRRGSGISS